MLKNCESYKRVMRPGDSCEWKWDSYDASLPEIGDHLRWTEKG